MKYENYEQIESIVKQINAHKEMLKLINSKPIVTIKENYIDNKIVIDTQYANEVDCGCFALDFLQAIRYDYEKRIVNLKSMLSLL